MNVSESPMTTATSTSTSTPRRGWEGGDWPNDAELEALAMVRNSRSQSLTDRRCDRGPEAPRRRTVLAVPPSIVTSDDMDLDRGRHFRRVLSAEFRDPQGNLSLLQQELGYPRPRSTPSTGKRSSRRSRNSATRNSLTAPGDETHEDTNHDLLVKKTRSLTAGSKASSDVATCTSSFLGDDEDGEAVEHEPDSELTSDHEDQGDSEEEENFLDRRVASVTGYARDTDGVVYYEIVVESIEHGPLSAYKVRRRYSEFRELHRALAKIMPRRAHSRAKSRMDTRHATPERRYTIAAGMHGRHQDPFATRGHELLELSMSAASAVSADHHHSRRASELGRAGDTGGGAIVLPPLPDQGGIWSYFQGDSPRFLENRTKAFHAILSAAQQHPAVRATRLLNRFLGTPPDCEATYVSLNRFAAPTLRFSVEIQERKEKAISISRRRRQRIDSLGPRNSSPAPTILE